MILTEDLTQNRAAGARWKLINAFNHGEWLLPAMKVAICFKVASEWFLESCDIRLPNQPSLFSRDGLGKRHDDRFDPSVAAFSYGAGNCGRVVGRLPLAVVWANQALVLRRVLLDAMRAGLERVFQRGVMLIARRRHVFLGAMARLRSV